MFGKLARFKAVRFGYGAWYRHGGWSLHGGSSRHGTWPHRRLHAGANRPACRLAPASLSTVRPVLLCHWQPASGRGGLECRWKIETIGETADGEPVGSRAALQISRLTSIALARDRHPRYRPALHISVAAGGRIVTHEPKKAFSREGVAKARCRCAPRMDY
jgi:hypothetical protein